MFFIRLKISSLAPFIPSIYKYNRLLFIIFNTLIQTLHISFEFLWCRTNMYKSIFFTCCIIPINKSTFDEFLFMLSF